MGTILTELSKRFPNYPHLAVVEEFVDNVVREMNPLFIIMFGALPRGDYTFNSDVDVLLVFEEQVTWNEVFAFGKGVVQPISKTKDAFISQLEKGNAFFIQIMEEGIILHSHEDVHDIFKSVAANTITNMKMIRVQKGWETEDDEELEDEEQ